MAFIQRDGFLCFVFLIYFQLSSQPNLQCVVVFVVSSVVCRQVDIKGAIRPMTMMAMMMTAITVNVSFLLASIINHWIYSERYGECGAIREMQRYSINRIDTDQITVTKTNVFPLPAAYRQIHSLLVTTHTYRLHWRYRYIVDGLAYKKLNWCYYFYILYTFFSYIFVDAVVLHFTKQMQERTHFSILWKYFYCVAKINCVRNLVYFLLLFHKTEHRTKVFDMQLITQSGKRSRTRAGDHAQYFSVIEYIHYYWCCWWWCYIRVYLW